MSKLIIMGSGAAPGVPAIANGWGDCNPNNPKNCRSRTGVYLEIRSTKILIDTSPDIRIQLLNNNIRFLDAVLYTHGHADHLHGIDDLRDLNRILLRPLDVYANQQTSDAIYHRFPYLVADKEHMNNPIFFPSLDIHIIEEGKEFYVNDVKIVPISLEGHPVHSTGYIIDDGKLVYIADCKKISESGLKLITKQPEVLVMPLTTIIPQRSHMGLEQMLEYVKIINPRKTIINHMAVECDYDNVNKLTPDNVYPAYDNMTVEF